MEPFEELERLQLDEKEHELRKLIEVDSMPSPSEFQKYNQMIPNGAERILTIIEEEKRHRHNMEKSKLNARTTTKIFGFMLTLLMFYSTMNSGVTRLEFMLLWAVTLGILGLIFAPIIKENLDGRRNGRNYWM